jgi:hypothetical protein
MFTNMHNSPAAGNFCIQNGNAQKPAVMEDYNRHVVYMDKGERMANSYTISCRSWMDKKLFFHLLFLTVFNSCIHFSSSLKKTSHREFCLCLIKDMLTHAEREPWLQKPLEDQAILPPEWPY